MAANIAPRKILVVGAHPDDEILGCGGTLLRHQARGDSVYVCIVTKATRPLWKASFIRKKVREQAAVDRMLGVSKRINLGLPTTSLNSIPFGSLNRKVQLVVDAVKPDIVYTHFEHDLNYDHTLVHRACLVSARPPKRIAIRCFETLSETEWGTRDFRPNLWVDISEQLARKVTAFSVYRSEVRQFPHPRSGEGIRALAAKRGTEVCCPAAEAFQIIRETWEPISP